MATLRDEILREIAGCCISDESAAWAADKVAKLVEEKFTSTNSANPTLPDGTVVFYGCLCPKDCHHKVCL